MPEGEVAPDAGEPGVTVDVDQLGGPNDEGRKLTEVLLHEGYFMTGVVVVGGGSSHVYEVFSAAPYGLLDLVAPPSAGTSPRISRYLVCGVQSVNPPAPVTRTGAVTKCKGAGLSGASW